MTIEIPWLLDATDPWHTILWAALTEDITEWFLGAMILGASAMVYVSIWKDSSREARRTAVAAVSLLAFIIGAVVATSVSHYDDDLLDRRLQAALSRSGIEVVGEFDRDRTNQFKVDGKTKECKIEAAGETGEDGWGRSTQRSYTVRCEATLDLSDPSHSGHRE